MTTPADYLRDHVFGPSEDLAVLGALAGQSVCGLNLFATLADARDAYLESTPIYFFPVGDLAGETLGLHLRPQDVDSGRTALATLGEYGLIEVGTSVRATVVEALAKYEVRSTPAFHAGVALVNRLVDPDFYLPGRLGKLDDDNVRDVVARAVGGSAEYYDAATAGRPDDDKRRILSEPGAQAPRALVLCARLATVCDELDQVDEAATAAAMALDCYHHTAYTAKLAKLYALAERLAQQRPAAFTEQHRTQLATRTDRARLELAATSYERGDVAWGTKLMCDLCHDLGKYTAHPMGAVLRKHFEKLGWRWALELCALRGVADAAKSG